MTTRVLAEAVECNLNARALAKVRQRWIGWFAQVAKRRHVCAIWAFSSFPQLSFSLQNWSHAKRMWSHEKFRCMNAIELMSRALRWPIRFFAGQSSFGFPSSKFSLNPYGFHRDSSWRALSFDSIVIWVNRFLSGQEARVSGKIIGHIRPTDNIIKQEWNNVWLHILKPLFMGKYKRKRGGKAKIWAENAFYRF